MWSLFFNAGQTLAIIINVDNRLQDLLTQLTNYDSNEAYYIRDLRLDPNIPSPIKSNLVLKVEAMEIAEEYRLVPMLHLL